MLVKQVKYRKSLSKNQLELLELVSKFRFVTITLLCELIDKDRSTVYERLYVLTKQGYLEQIYDKSYRLLGKPASYVLTNLGIKLLREKLDLTVPAANYLYKSKTASQELVTHSIEVSNLYLDLSRQYSDRLKILTKTQMIDNKGLIRPLPDLYIIKKTNANARQRHYLLDYIEAQTPPFVIRRRIRAIEQWYWDYQNEVWGEDDPTVLLVCEDENKQNKVKRIINKYSPDYKIYTTTKALLNNSDTKIWSHLIHDWDDKDDIKSL